MKPLLVGLALLAASSLTAFVVTQAGDTATGTTWRAGIERRLDRIEDKLDRLIEGGIRRAR